MSETLIPSRFLVRGGTASAVAALNEIPKFRELVFETDTRKFKLGDGSTAYNSLNYVVTDATITTTDVTTNNATTSKHGFLKKLSNNANEYMDGTGNWSAPSGAIGDQASITYTEGSAPSTPASGKVITYAKTDGLMYSKDDAGTETLMSVGSGGAMTYVGSATVSGAAATTLAISGLDLDTHGRYYCELIADNATGSAAQVSLYYNADTTDTNYNRQGVLANGTGVTAARGNDGILAVMDASENLVLTFTICNDFDSKARARSFGNYGASASLKLRDFAHSWTSTANVTGITISSDVASSLAIGTVLKVWKIG